MDFTAFGCCSPRDGGEAVFELPEPEWIDSIQRGEYKTIEQWMNYTCDAVSDFSFQIKQAHAEKSDAALIRSATELCGVGHLPTIHLYVLCLSMNGNNRPRIVSIDKNLTPNMRGRALTTKIVNELRIIKEHTPVFTDEITTSKAFSLHRVSYDEKTKKIQILQNITETDDYITCLTRRKADNTLKYLALFTYDPTKPIIDKPPSCIVM